MPKTEKKQKQFATLTVSKEAIDKYDWRSALRSILPADTVVQSKADARRQTITIILSEPAEP